MPTVGILGEESFDHGGAWTERIAEPKFDAKKQVTVDLQQNSLKPPLAKSSSQYGFKNEMPSGILKKRLNNQGSSEYEQISSSSRQVVQSVDNSRTQRPKKKSNIPQFNWKDKQERMVLYSMQKCLTFEQIKSVQIAELTRWSQNDFKGQQKTLYLKKTTAATDITLTVTEQTRLEKLINYEDRFPLLSQRKSIQKVRILINMAAQKVVKNKIFENVSICVIMANSVTLGMSDPLQIGTTASETLLDNVFLGLYTAEMCLKILCYGFLFNDGAYLRDPWNMLDFVIVMSAYLTLFQTMAETLANGGVEVQMSYKDARQQAEDHSGGGLSLSSLRAFRVLRPLKAVTSIKGLQVLVLSVLTSLPLLKDTIIVLLSFFMIFAIACTQILSGQLKNRCINIETGVPIPDSDDQNQGYGLCGGTESCDEGYFCGKSGDSPCDGITNFDNILYSLLVIFIVITMEGWSEIMIYYVRSFNSLSWVLFFPMVFIGSFFLINLLLAVINSSFSTTFNEQQDKMAAELAKKSQKKPAGGDELDLDEENENKIGINTYWVAKRAAQRMIQQFRKIQAIKYADELERKNRPPEEDDDEPKQIVIQMPEPYVPPVVIIKELAAGDSEGDDLDFDLKLQDLLTSRGDEPLSSERRLISNNIRSFAVNDMRTSNQNQLKTGDEYLTAIRTQKPESKSQVKFNMKIPIKTNKFSELFNIKKVVKLDESIQVKEEQPFDLSEVHSQEINYPDISNIESDEDQIDKITRKKVRNEDEEQISAIASDSSFAEELKPKELLEESEPETVNEKQDVQTETESQQRKRKNFRRVRSTEVAGSRDNFERQSVGSTQFNEEKNSNEVQSQISVMMSEHSKKAKKKKPQKKGPKKSNVDPAPNTLGLNVAEDKYNSFYKYLRANDGEFLEEKKEKDPYLYIDGKEQKIELCPRVPYLSNSMNEVLEMRNQLQNALAVHEENQFLKCKLPDFAIQPDEELEEFLQELPRPEYEAYQLKTVYQIDEVEEVSFDEDDDDALILALQPFDTITSVGYGHLLTHQPVKFVARRSDIIVSSSLSITLSPADAQYRILDKALLTPKQASIYCHKRCVYRAMLTKIHSLDQKDIETIVNNHQTPKKLTAQDMIDSQKTSTLNAQDMLNLQAMSRPKMIPQTLLTKPLAPEKVKQLNEDEKRLYNIQKGKYDTHCRVTAKKIQGGENPVERKFKLAEIDTLINGKHHEEEEAEEEEAPGPEAMLYMGRNDTFRADSMNRFEKEARQLLRQSRQENERGPQTFIPSVIRSELDFGEDLGDNQICFNEVIKADMSRKRKTPQWSGQDVLQIGINNDLSRQVLQKINSVRVWPKGGFGLLKKARVLLKMMVKHDLFDTAMTLAVGMNTCVMATEQYNMSLELRGYTEMASTVFTYVFIGEMTSKILAIGPNKYLADKLNWLDGGIVSLSLIEIFMNLAQGSGGNQEAFKAIRVLRTFRVLRMMRLLRALQSMRVIIAVIARSFSSFVYITVLLFVFIFIFTLLGMSLFGGNFEVNDNYRGYFDSFIVAFLTVFQIVTTENWNTLLFSCMTSASVGLYIPTLYFISWIFIGNYILLNLFLAILLDGFLCEDDEEIGDIEEMQRLAKIERRRKQKKEKERRLKKLGSTLDPQSSLVREWRDQSSSKKQVVDEIDDLDDLDQKMIREIFMDEGLIKKKDKEREARLLFLGVQCEKALYIFTKKNPIRSCAYKIYKHKAFDNTIMFLIGVASVKLALDTYLKDLPDDDIYVLISNYVDYILNAGFLFECGCKNLALGFIMDEGSYLRDSWNKMDFFIVCSSVLDMSLINVKLPVIKILRLLRTLRPLRVISQNKDMKLMVGALAESLGAIANVCVVVVAVWLMYAIFAINIFAGKFFYCDIGTYVYHTKYECNRNGGSWVRYVQSFDNIFLAMQSLFDVAVIEGWPDVMNSAIDAVDVDKGPQLLATTINGFFFLGFILIGSFFLMNFFTGVMFLKYNQVEAREKVGYTPENITWVAIQKMIIDQRCDHAIMNKPDYRVHPRRFKAWNIVNSMGFEIFIMAIILLNVVQMGINFENAPVLYAWLLDQTNYFFTAIFIIEMLLKLQAYNWRYFETAWHKFDFFIVSASLVDILISFFPSNGSGAMSMIPQISRIMRVLRVTRVIKLAGKNEGLQALMSTITLSIGALANVCVLLMLTLFIFAVLGVFMFQDVKEGQNFIGIYRNFGNFWNAFQNLYILTTGENWNYCMFDMMNTPPNCVPGETCGTPLAPFYFISFVMFVQNVMLNLFVLVIISQFETYYMATDNPIKKFKKNLDIFMVTWIEFTVKQYRCIKLREKQLNMFFKTLPMPFGLPPETTDGQMKKIMLQMGIRCDDGYVYFNELLYRCMRRKYGSFKLNRRMQIIELKTQYKIYQITLSQQNLNLDNFSQKTQIYDQFFSKMIGVGKAVNPFLLQMYFNISFNTWLNYSRRMGKRERFYLKQEKVRSRCVRDGKPFNPEEYVEPPEPLIEVTIEVSDIIYYSSEEEVVIPVQELKLEEDAFNQQNEVENQRRSSFKSDKKSLPSSSHQIGIPGESTAKKTANNMQLLAISLGNQYRQSMSPALINSSLSPVPGNLSEIREPQNFSVSASHVNADDSQLLIRKQ